MNISGLSFKYIRQHKTRTILSIISIIISVAMITMLGSMIMGLRDLMVFDYKSINGYHQAIYNNIDYPTYKKLKANVSINDIVLSKNLGYAFNIIYKNQEKRLQEEDNNTKYFYYVNAIGNNCEKIFPDLLKEGRFPENSNEIIVYDQMFKNLQKPKLNEEISLDIGNMDENFKKLDSNIRKFKIVGIMDDDKRTDASINFAIIGLDESIESNLFDAYIFTDTDYNVSANIESIAAKLGIDYENIIINSAYYETYGFNMYNLVIAFAGSIFILIIGASTFGGIYTVFNISYAQRQRQYGLMRAIGATEKQIKDINKREIIILSIIGVPLGIIFGYLLLSMMFNWSSKDVFEILGFSDFKLKIYPQLMLFVSLISFATIYLSIYSASFRKSNLSPVEIIRRSDFDGARVRDKKYFFTKLLFGMEGYLARRNIDRTRGKFFLSSISIAVTITIFVSSVYATDLFKRNLAAYQNIPDYELNYHVDSDDMMDSALKAKFMNISGTREVIGYYYIPISVDANIENDPDILKDRLINERVEENLYTIFSSRLYIMTSDDIKKKFYVTEEEMQRVIENKSAFLYVEQSNGIQLVDFISGPDLGIGLSSEHYFRMPIGNYEIGYNDGLLYSPPGITILMPVEVAKEYISLDFIKNVAYYMEIKMYDKYTGTHEMDEYLDSRRDMNIIRNIDKKIQRDSQLKTMKNYLYGFSGLMALVSAINIINSIGSNMITRKKELSLLKAIGMNKSSFKKMMRIEAIYYSILGSFLGFIFSLVTTGILNEAFNVISGDGGYIKRYLYPVGSYFLIVFVTIIIVYISCLITMRTVIGNDLIGNLRNE